MIRNAHLASRFFNRPLALLPSHAAILFDLVQSDVRPGAFSPSSDSDSRVVYRPYDVQGGLAIIRISGVLVHGDDWFFWGMQTSYDQLRGAIAAAIGDDEVVGLVFLVDSPGGECAALFDLVDAIYGLRGIKPIHAIVDEAAYSAAYALTSSADKVWVSRTAGTGSIGIIWQHTSIAGMLDKMGVEVTTLTYGDRKADGYPTEKFSSEAAKRMQADIDTLGELFVDTVARNRGLAASKVRAMQAGTFLGAAGVEAGLADGVMSADEAFLAILDEVA